MEKLPMCRICLAQNVRMYIVVDKNLHELYEKLTRIPFVTEDCRPILACFLCFSKLKQCWRLLKKCLESEVQFVKIMKEDYEPNAFINLDCFELYSGLSKSPIQHMSTFDECQTESNYITIKQEIPVVCEGLDDFIEIEEDRHSDELEPDNLYQSSLEVEVDIPPQHSESDSEDDKPLIEFETEEVEEDVYKMEANATETKKLEQDNFHQNSLEVEVDIPPHHSKSDSEDVDHLMEIGSEVVEEEEVNEMEVNATETKRTTVAKKQGLDTQTTILEDPRSTKKTAKKKVIRKTQRLAKRGAYFNAPYKCEQGTQMNEKLMYYVMERTRKSNLTEYILVQTDDKPHKCGVCERSFSQKAHLQRHTLVHTGEKPFKCDVCHRGLADKAALRHHIRRHTGEKPYKCDVCERSFSMKAALRKHISSHNSYKCNVCKLSFSQNVELKKHIRLRTCEAPFKCNICERGFSIRSNLMRHILIHTGEKPFNCPVCQRSFRHKSALRKHLRTHTKTN